MGSVPQSQDSPSSLLPLPHSALSQWLGSPEQAAPGSFRHKLEQPSPSFAFPSSQVSVPLILPSPHLGTQRLPGTWHSNPPSVLHSDEQPSLLSLLPSSQLSLAARTPSPHTGGSHAPNSGHFQPCSI